VTVRIVGLTRFVVCVFTWLPAASTTRTVYPVIADPPVFVGAVHATIAVPDEVPLVAIPIVGAPGTVIGVTGDDRAE